MALSAEVAQTYQLAPDVVGVDIELPKRSTTFPASIASCSFRISQQGPTARPYRWKAPPTITCCTFISERSRTDW